MGKRLATIVAASVLAVTGDSPVFADDGYGYDALGRVTSACHYTPSSSQRTEYGLDPAGNRAQFSSFTTTTAIPRNTGIDSPDGRFHFIMQADGNLVLYGPSGALWASNTNTGQVAYLQADGNLVVYDGNGSPIWASNSSGQWCSVLYVQPDGNVVLYNLQHKPVWATNTSGH